VAGRALSAAKWKVGDPLGLLKMLKLGIDIIASILPFGSKSDSTIVLKVASESEITVQGDFGQQILAASAMRLGAGW